MRLADRFSDIFYSNTICNADKDLLNEVFKTEAGRNAMRAYEVAAQNGGAAPWQIACGLLAVGITANAVRKIVKKNRAKKEEAKEKKPIDKKTDGVEDAEFREVK